MDQMLRDLAMARLEAEAASLRKNRLEESPALVSARDDLARARSKVGELESRIKDENSAQVKRGGECHPALKIRVMRPVVIRSEAKAIEWAESNAPVLLKKVLDVKAFEKIVKSLPEFPEEVAAIEPQIITTIPSDLSAYVGDHYA